MSPENALQVPCCPEFPPDAACDALDFHYHLKYPTQVTHRDRRVTVEVTIHARFERCPGPLALGDLVYSTTLLPGERVRLFTADRRTRFTFDSSSQLSYRNQQTSEERFYAASMHDSMTDISSRDSQSAHSSARGSARGHGETSGAIGSFLFAGPTGVGKTETAISIIVPYTANAPALYVCSWYFSPPSRNAIPRARRRLTRTAPTRDAITMSK